MATDEAMMAYVQGSGRPLLRLYRMVPAALSLGRAQSLAEVYLPGVRAIGADLVRRPSGGKAVLHDLEVTYALAAPEGRFPASVVESYQVIAGGLLLAVRRWGLEAAFSHGSFPSGEKAANCFVHPSFYELTIAGKKCIGSAQVRHRGALLQHGSVPLVLDFDRWSACFAPPGPARKEWAQTMAARARGLFQDRPSLPPYEEVMDALARGMEEAHGVRMEVLKDRTPLAALAEERLREGGIVLGGRG